MTNSFNSEKLRLEIEQLRSKMIKIATQYGYTSTESIKLSQELDYLLNEYQTLVSKEKKLPSKNPF